LACGACREIRELKLETKRSLNKEVSFVLVDQDLEALKFAKERINFLSNNLHFKFIQADVLNFVIENMEDVGKLKKFDLVYTIGLADYLPDSYLISLVKHSFNILSEGGELIIAHKNVREFFAPIPDWMCDWKFVPRSNVELSLLVKKALNGCSYKYKCIFSKKRLVYYFDIMKVIDK
jgi:SAM-dependent methyltransferase